MPNHRLLAVVTALMLIGGAQSGHAEYSIAQLQEIERLILSKDINAIWLFLAANPEILNGSDPLAVELRTLAESIENGLVGTLAFQSPPVGTAATNDPSPDAQPPASQLSYLY